MKKNNARVDRIHDKVIRTIQAMPGEKCVTLYSPRSEESQIMTMWVQEDDTHDDDMSLFAPELATAIEINGSMIVRQVLPDRQIKYGFAFKDRELMLPKKGVLDKHLPKEEGIGYGDFGEWLDAVP